VRQDSACCTASCCSCERDTSKTVRTRQSGWHTQDSQDRFKSVRMTHTRQSGPDSGFGKSPETVLGCSFFAGRRGPMIAPAALPAAAPANVAHTRQSGPHTRQSHTRRSYTRQSHTRQSHTRQSVFSDARTDDSACCTASCQPKIALRDCF